MIRSLPVAGGTGDQQVRHGREVRHANPAVQIAAHCQRQLAPGIDELRRLDDIPQRNRLPLVVRNFDADVDFPGIRSIKIDSACSA